jgi:L-alanine-DL-glutamate epimerase-like enolase superfamily enzyme
MPKVISVEARTVVVPLDQVTSFARRTVNARHYTLVRVTAESGIRGIGFCYAGSFGGEVVSRAVRDLVAPSVVGDESTRVRGVWDDTYQSCLLHGRAGSVMRALSAVDIALWDLNARNVDLPLWRYLGGTVRDVVPAYASGGYYLEGKGPAELAVEMRGYLDIGFDAVKMKVGRASPATDEQRVAAVRAEVGPDTLVMLDANNAWTDLPTALLYMARFEKYDPYWIEEPFSPDDIENHAKLAQRTSVSIATGEIEAGRWRHKQLLDAGVTSILQTDAAVCGGITEFQRIAAMADAYGAVMAPHWFHDLHVHLVASTSNARFVEFFPDDSVLNFRRLVDTQLDIVPTGGLRVPETPGLGFDFNEEAVTAFAVDAWS